jgi:uncharacterized protein YndB with AHSA1/START domain
MTNQQAANPSGVDDGSVVVTQRIAAPPEAVFPFLVEPERMMRWIGTDARLTPTPGGEFWLNMNDTDIAVGTFTEIDPPNRVVFTWGWQGSDDVPPGSSTVSIDLTVDGSDTIVELRHSDLPDGLRARHHDGWGNFLALLAEQVIAPH